ncbi:hypothetical protein M3D53_09405 [Dermabacter hominis]|uniref:hypothetical protein n=1 Tax=Dermabacter hominis TaxID=36740 RepID=UPI0021A78C40|nr:hypothetical protein [Dermabacter hominis]MCT2056837.1 hypothetical protein [Dermabacter hominis]MCT2084326.1 hypothetical protein [Dermabacter hominis]MCT2091979.1 hypothetical protein [Dermabacter hominis]MCT2190182.1 hypothetical protein [Dermabacter hominis]MCT2227879.1 hypothetical protein [Dermabacter hominis]
MSLLSSDALTRNEQLRRRVCAAIRKQAATRDTPFAKSAFTMPEGVVGDFLLELASNTEVVSKACAECGGSSNVPDDTIEWIVGDTWAKIEKAHTPQQ